MTSIVNVKVDPKIKKQAQDVADELGLSLSAIIKAYLKELVRTRRVTFNADEPSDFLRSSLEAAERDIKTQRLSPSFSKADDAITWLKDPQRDNED